MAARLVRDEGVAGSNPATPTSTSRNPDSQRHRLRHRFELEMEWLRDGYAHPKEAHRREATDMACVSRSGSRCGIDQPPLSDPDGISKWNLLLLPFHPPKKPSRVSIARPAGQRRLIFGFHHVSPYCVCAGESQTDGNIPSARPEGRSGRLGRSHPLHEPA